MPVQQEHSRIVRQSYQLLQQYLAKRPLECFDRVDFRAIPWLITIQQARARGNPLASLTLKAIFVSAMTAPFLLRKMLGVKPTMTASGLAFYASALIECYLLEGSMEFLDKAAKLLECLLKMNVNTPEKPAWGFPFAWQSFEYLPANTPIGYTTYTCADAFFAYYRATADKQALATAISACTFIAERINRTPCGDGTALSYTPLDTSQVPNSNSLVASLMLALDQASGTRHFTDLAESVFRFILHRQQPDGSWFYAADGTRIDHYHTAMTIQGLVAGLSGIRDQYLKERVQVAVRRGVEFHLKYLWRKGIPCNSTKVMFPLDPMSPAESIILFHMLLESDSCLASEMQIKVRDCWLETAIWTVQHMQYKDGAFPTLYHPLRSLLLRSLRWGDAQLLRALALTVRRFDMLHDPSPVASR